jgi:hypothetical protein
LRCDELEEQIQMLKKESEDKMTVIRQLMPKES